SATSSRRPSARSGTRSRTSRRAGSISKVAARTSAAPATCRRRILPCGSRNWYSRAAAVKFPHPGPSRRRQRRRILDRHRRGASMSKLFRFLIMATLALAWAPAARAGELKLTIANGRVTLIAQDVQVKQILAEWTRVGGTQIVGGDKLNGQNV